MVWPRLCRVKCQQITSASSVPALQKNFVRTKTSYSIRRALVKQSKIACEERWFSEASADGQKKKKKRQIWYAGSRNKEHNASQKRRQYNTREVFTANPNTIGTATDKDRLERLFLSNSALKATPTNLRFTKHNKEPNAAVSISSRDLSKLPYGGRFEDHKVGQSIRRPTLISSRDWITLMIARLREAVLTQNLGMVLHEWSSFQLKVAGTDPDAGPRTLDELFGNFLTAFLTLRKAETAVEVWNFMVQKGHKPQIWHWTAMLRGCNQAQDTSSLEDVWIKMRNSNIEPDIFSWTTYIQGLIKGSRWQDGLAALDELGRIWKPLTKNVDSRSQSDQLHPCIAPVNAALQGLVDIEKLEHINSVLAWADEHKISLDVYTYNILLRPIARGGNMNAIRAHLQLMSKNGCQPDVATFAVIFSSIFASSDPPIYTLPPEKQKTIIFAMFQDMENNNVPFEPHIYTVVLSGLLVPPKKQLQNRPSLSTAPKSQPIDLSVVHTLFDHMHAHSVRPSPHIYTMLLKYYFSLSPPDLSAVRSLWTTISKQFAGSESSSIHIDATLYETMINGLSEANQLDDAIGMIKQMTREGKSPGWLSLKNCLDALCKADDWKRVKWFVGEVERPGGFLRWGQRSMRMRNAWLRTVEYLRSRGVLD